MGLPSSSPLFSSIPFSTPSSSSPSSSSSLPPSSSSPSSSSKPSTYSTHPTPRFFSYAFSPPPPLSHLSLSCSSLYISLSLSRNVIYCDFSQQLDSCKNLSI